MAESAGQSGEGGDSRPAASTNDASVTLHPETSSVLAALADRGIEIPGLQRPAGERKADEDAGAPRYTVMEQVGRGGMGVVLRVRDEDLRRELAMKVLDRADRGVDAQASVPRDLGRFLEEAQVTGQLDHPGVPAIHELGLGRDGRLFFTMKLVRGGTFGDVINKVRAGEEGWTTTRALGVLLKVCEALAYAHHKGVMHRDIKPANIMVGRFGETYVMDWGLAKVLDGGKKSDSAPSYDSLVSRSIVHTDRREARDDIGSSHATLDGDVVGTPAYMAPEQARGQLEALGPHSDIYAVGALLYHLLAGQAPYVEPGVRVSAHTVLRWVIDGPPKPLASLAPSAPPELIAIIEKAMNREPSLRYTSMLDLAADLQAFIEDRVVRAYQTGAWAEARKWMVRNKPLAAAAGLLLLVTIGALGAVSWVESTGRDAVEERNKLLGASNAALENANVQLASTNTALDAERAAAELAREEALANAERAEANELRALTEGYAANLTAAVAALESGAGAAARRHLAACPEELRGWEWQHLSLRADPSLAVWTPEESLLWDAAYSPDGRYVATAIGPAGNNFGADISKVHLRDASTGETILELPSDVSVNQVSFSPDGSLLAWGTAKYVSLWDMELQRPRFSQHWLGQECYSLSFLDADRLVVVATDSDNNLSRLDIWNHITKRVEFTRDSDPAMKVATASPDGQHLAIGRSDFSVQLIDILSGESVWSTPGRSGVEELASASQSLPGINSIAFNPSGERLAVSAEDGTLSLLDVRDGREIARHELSGESKPVELRFHPDGPWIVIGDTSGSVRFHDAETLSQVERLAGHDRAVLGLAISPSGDRIVSGDLNGSVRVWDGRPGAASLVVPNRAATSGLGNAPWMRGLDFSPDGRFVAWTPGPRAVLLADALTGVVLYRLAEVDSAVSGLGFTQDGERLIVSSEVEGISTYSVRDGRLLSAVKAGAYSNLSAFDPSRSIMAKVQSRTERRLDIHIVESGVRALSLNGHEDTVWGFDFSADSQQLVSGSEDGTIRIWDLLTGEATQVIQDDRSVYRLHLLDDDRAVSTSLDPTRSGLSLWNLKSGELLARHPASGLLLRGDMHPGGRLWAGTNSGQRISLWDVERGEMFSLPVGEFGPTHLRFDPTGTRLAAIDRGGNLILWDTVHPRERSVERREASRLARYAGEARRLVDEVLDEQLLTWRVLDVLGADTSLDTDLREAAVRDLRVRGDDATSVIEEIWKRLLPDEIPVADLLDSLELVERARALMPILLDVQERWSAYQDAREPALWALILLGEMDEAAEQLPEAVDTGYTFNPAGPSVALTLQALTSALSGELSTASKQLKEAREQYEQALIDAPGDFSDLRATARLIGLVEHVLDERGA